MIKILQLINDERKTKPLLATAMINRRCAPPTDGFAEGSNCGVEEDDDCPSASSEDSCFECYTKHDGNDD